MTKTMFLCLAVFAASAAGLTDIKPLFDYPVRDTSICRAPDDWYYLTGTTGTTPNKTGGGEMLDGWWYVNRGIELWRSRDLKDWERLGLVWSIEKDGTWQKKFKDHNSGGRKSAPRRALWAPEIHYLKGTFWLTYSMNYGGTGLLKSTTGKPQGPYVDVQPAGSLTPNIDASLFQDDDGKVYFVWQNGMIARLKDDLSGLAEEPRLLKPVNHKQVGFEGAFITKAQGKYLLLCADFNPAPGGKTYDCMAASADSIYGPYGERYLAIPHGGHNMLFQDTQGQWWSTFFGHNTLAPIHERPAILPIHINAAGKIEVGR